MELYVRIVQLSIVKITFSSLHAVFSELICQFIRHPFFHGFANRSHTLD